MISTFHIDTVENHITVRGDLDDPIVDLASAGYNLARRHWGNQRYDTKLWTSHGSQWFRIYRDLQPIRKVPVHP